MLGGERWSNYALSGYSEKAQCTGNTLAYLEPRGVHNSIFWRFIASFLSKPKLSSAKLSTKKYTKTNNAHPSEPNRNTMQKPIGGRSLMALFQAKNMLNCGFP